MFLTEKLKLVIKQKLYGLPITRFDINRGLDFSVLSHEVDQYGGVTFMVLLDTGGVYRVKVKEQDLAEYQLPESS